MDQDESITVQAKSYADWTLYEVFDFNPDYIKQIRGMLHIGHLVVTMLTLSIVGGACQMTPYVDSSARGFYCRSPDTFTFVMACSAFLNSLLLFMCCILSKKTEQKMLTTSFEFVFYIFYASFFFIAGINLTSSVISRNVGEAEYEDKYATSVTGGIFGVFCCIAYGASAVWFYLYHKNQGKEDSG